jgi:hypothetical protein
MDGDIDARWRRYDNRLPIGRTALSRRSLRDGLRLFQVLRHLKVMLQRRKRLAGPLLQVGVLAAVGVTFEQGNRVLVSIDLHRIEIRRKVPARSVFQLVELALVRAVERGREFDLDFAAADHALQFGARLGVVGDHLRRKGLFRGISLFLCQLVRLNFEHVADGDLFDEIVGGWADTQRRVNAGFLTHGLGKRWTRQNQAGERDQ